MNKTALTIILVAVVIVIGMMVFRTPNNTGGEIKNVQNVEVRDGIQYVTINAKGGYIPRQSVAKADIPTKLIVKTNNTYDCSLSLVVKQAGFQKILPRTGEEIIDLGIKKGGESVRGVCGMGMYNFVVNFE